MPFEYDDHKWEVSPTTDDINSLFHAAFGHRKTTDKPYTDDMATLRRLNWQNFLSFYETRPKPTFLKDTLQNLFKDRGWSFENDENFREYVENVGEDRQVLLSELPVIASLENVKLVVFEDQTSPSVIEPCIEALTDYPLETDRPMTTAVIVFKDSAYSRLTSRGPKSVDGEKEVVISEKFQKSKLSGSMSGVWYQLNLLKIALLNALDKNSTWRMSVEDLRAGYFDDLVLEFGPDNLAYLLQAKWKERRKITAANLFENKGLRSFSLARYFFSYQEVKNNYNIHSLVLCTNAEIKFDWLEDFVDSRDLTKHDLLYFEDCRSICHTFNRTIVPVLLEKFQEYPVAGFQKHLTEDNVKSFLKYFQIISLYPREKNLEQAIEDEIVTMGLCEKYEGPDYYRYLNKKVIEWFDDPRGVYMTPLRANAIFSGLRSDKLLAKLHSLNLSLKPGALHFAALKRVTHIIPQNDFTLSLIKLYGFLKNYESRTLFVSNTESVQIQKMMARAFEFKQYSYLVIYKSSSGKNEQELCDIIAPIVRKDVNKKVILVADQQDELAKLLKAYDEGIFETIDDNVTFTDLTEDSQEQLMDKVVSLAEASL